MTSKEYWDNRAAKRLIEAEKQSNDYIKKVKKIYSKANNDIKKELANVYKNYSKETGVDVHTLKNLLSKEETDEFWKTLKGQGLKKYVQANYKSRINRLEQIQGQLYAKAKEIYKEELNTVYGHYRSVINESYNKTIYDTQIGTGYDFTFNKLDDKMIETVLNTKWYGGNYSSRIWGNTDILANRVSETIGGALISGKPYYKTANEIADTFGVAQYYAERLVRTETNHFNAEAEALAYKELGVEKYVFVATLDNRTSKMCQEHDGKIYDFKDMETGVNYPPLHPNCRSTTRGYLGEEEEKTLKRRARNPVTGKTEIIDNMNYEEWKKHINNRYGNDTLEVSAQKQVNLKSDTEQYEKYLKVLGKKNMPETFEKWQEMKYNNINEYKLTRYNYKLRNEAIGNPQNVIKDICIADEKYTKYLFDGNNKDGLIKGELIDKILGYNKDNYKQFDVLLKENISRYPKRFKGEDKYGQKYEINMVIKGLKDRQAKVTIGSRFINNEYKLSSVYINELKESELKHEN